MILVKIQRYQKRVFLNVYKRDIMKSRCVKSMNNGGLKIAVGNYCALLRPLAVQKWRVVLLKRLSDSKSV